MSKKIIRLTSFWVETSESCLYLCLGQHTQSLGRAHREEAHMFIKFVGHWKIEWSVNTLQDNYNPEMISITCNDGLN